MRMNEASWSPNGDDLSWWTGDPIPTDAKPRASVQYPDLDDVEVTEYEYDQAGRVVKKTVTRSPRRRTLPPYAPVVPPQAPLPPWRKPVPNPWPWGDRPWRIGDPDPTERGRIYVSDDRPWNRPTVMFSTNVAH